MNELFFMVTVAERERLADFIKLYQENGISVSFISLGYGTASNDVLDYLGLDNKEKAVCFSLITDTLWKKIKKELLQKLYIGSPGTGIVFVSPLSSIGGKRELAFLTQGQHYQRGDESTLKETQNELLVIVSNQGYNEAVMDAARSAGAAGGTVIHAKGTGMQSAEKFLGISLAAEKDMILIVAQASQKKAIMQAVMQKAGMESKAKSIIFTLPVTDAAGLRFFEENE